MRARHLQALGALVAVGAALRFATLDAQSFWQDEAATIDLLRDGFADMLRRLPESESTPPLYYVVAWLWSQIAGTGEIGVRALSALFGTATIPVAYGIGARISGTRAGLIVAALVATNPYLVWYSQEARAYALLVLLTALAVLFLVRGNTRAWAVTSALAIGTHYFAVFPAIAGALWLGRRALPAIGAVGLVGLALLPLALDQRSTENAGFIDESSLIRRAAQVPKQFTTGYDAPAETILTAVALLLVVIAVAGLAHADRGRLRPVLLVGTATVTVPLALALAGIDYLLARNVLPALVPLAAIAAAGFAAQRFGKEAAALLAVIGAALAIATAIEPAYQRDDWRGAAAAIGPPERDRAIIVTPPAGILPLRLYLPGAREMPPGGLPVSEIAVVSVATRTADRRRKPARPARPVPPAAVFGEVGRTNGETFTALLYRADSAIHVPPTVGQTPLQTAGARTLFQRVQPPGG